MNASNVDAMALTDPAILLAGAQGTALSLMTDTDQVRQTKGSVSAELRDSESRFSQMIDALPAAIYTTDAQGRLTHFNPACVEFSGRTPELGNDQWCVSWKLYHADGTPMPHDECPMAIALKEGRILRGIEAIIELPDGTRRWFTPYPTPLRDSEGKIVGGINMLVDITERKRTEEALRASEEHFRALFELGPVAVYSIDPSGVIQNFNRRAAELWGRAPAHGDTDERFCGSYKLFRPDGSFMPHAQCPMAEVVAGKIPAAHDAEVLIERPDGSRVTVVVNIRPLKSEQGKITGAINCFYDITERKRAEEQLTLAQAQLADRATQLEALVAERTARLQETIGELEHFSYTITHDMRAPLRAMQGFCGMLQEEAAKRLPPESAEHLRRVINASRRMDALIRDSLQYARVLRERIPLASVEPASVLRGILESYPNLQSPQVQIQIVEPLPAVIANETGLCQCFANLLTNAVKFVKPGTLPHVRIRAEIRSSAPSASEKAASLGARQPVVRLWFEDNGIGIPQEYHERVFGMFQQLDKSYEGTGIGLALVRKMAERMDGKAGVESEPGKGSRFWLEFRKASVNPST